jgi:hypothetical protein
VPLLYAPPLTEVSESEFVGPALSTLAMFDVPEVPWLPTLSESFSRYS